MRRPIRDLLMASLAIEPKLPYARTNPIGELLRTALSEIEPGGFQQAQLEPRWRRYQG